jgi:hypothetical protein
LRKTEQTQLIRNAGVEPLINKNQQMKKAIGFVLCLVALTSFAQTEQADQILQKARVYSVLDKRQIPPSGDKHDYMSQGPYWWPDSTKKDGKPYIRRDGVRNPEIDLISDSEEMDWMTDDVVVLTKAFEQTKDEKYARFATRLIETWFLDPATRQTPHLNFGQGIPGINTGRGIGIIETRLLYKITDAATRLRASKTWTTEKHSALKAWFSAYLTWLIESPIGLDEADEHNNHGTYYDVQVVNYALFVGKDALAKKQLKFTKKRIESQIKPDGSQPFEMARTKSLGYCVMNLTGFFLLADLGNKIKVDLWHYESPSGASLQKAYTYLMPYLTREKAWPHQQIVPFDKTEGEDLVRWGDLHYLSK